MCILAYTCTYVYIYIYIQFNDFAGGAKPPQTPPVLY